MTTTQYQGWIEDKAGTIIEPPKTFETEAEATRFVQQWMKQWREQPSGPSSPHLEFRLPKVARTQA